MELLTKLFVTHGPVQTVLVLSATVVFGILLGRISIGGIRFGIGGILFSGIILGHFGFSLDPKLLVFTREFGLILFVFAVGMQVGPNFLESLRDQGLRLNCMAVFIVVSGALVALLCWKGFGLSIPQTAGLFSGAVTNTPALGSASEAWTQVAGSEVAVSDGLRVMGMAYAVAYPFGILGIILTMLLLRAFFHIDVKKEIQEMTARQRAQHPPLRDTILYINNPELEGKPLSILAGADGVVAAVYDKTGMSIPIGADTMLTRGMHIHAWGTEAAVQELRQRLKADEVAQGVAGISFLSTRSFLVSSTDIIGKKLSALHLRSRCGIVITHIIRNGMEMLPRQDTRLRLEDRVYVVGKDDALDAAPALFGNSRRELGKAQVLPIFIGIFLGVLLGSIPVAVPGLPTGVKLGVAGGTLLTAIVLSRIHYWAGLTWHMPTGSNLLLREIGILLFLACVGLHAGTGFVDTVVRGPGLAWMGMGTLITFVPIFTAALFCRSVWHTDYPSLCGMLAGSMTDPPALAFSMQFLGSSLPASAYATVYPLTMVLRILAGQLLVLCLFGMQ